MSYCGYKLFYNRENALIARIRREKEFETELIDAMVTDIKHVTHPVVLDIGANLGLVSLALCRRQPSVTIHAFEPGLIQRTALQKSVHDNFIQKIQVYPYALSSTNGVSEFFVHTEGDQAKDGLRDTKRGATTTVSQIETLTLDTWCAQCHVEHIDVIKIDTEGAELLVLQGAEITLKSLRPIIYLEISPKNYVAYCYVAHDIVDILTRYNYRLQTLEGEIVTSQNIKDLLEKHDTFRALPL
jgi:FkbM family methyltransferase